MRFPDSCLIIPRIRKYIEFYLESANHIIITDLIKTSFDRSDPLCTPLMVKLALFVKVWHRSHTVVKDRNYI